MKLRIVTFLFAAINALFVIDQGAAAKSEFNLRASHPNDEIQTQSQTQVLFEIDGLKEYQTSDDESVLGACFVDAYNQVEPSSKDLVVGFKKSLPENPETGGYKRHVYYEGWNVYLTVTWYCRGCVDPNDNDDYIGWWDMYGHLSESYQGDYFDRANKFISPLDFVGGGNPKESIHDHHLKLEVTFCSCLRKTGLDNFASASNCGITYLYHP